MSTRAYRNILLYDLYQGGHHAQYLDQLGSAWLDGVYPGRIDILVHTNTASEPRLIELAARSEGRIRLHGVRPSFDLEADRRLRVVRNDLEHGRLLKRAVADLAPDHCVCMYLDHVQLSLAADLRLRNQTAISGIYFRPSFHYAFFQSEQTTARQSLTRSLKRALIGRAMRNPSFRYLFCLDPFVPEYLPAHPPRTRAIPLPDGVPPLPTSDDSGAIRRRLNASADRKLGVLFGVLDERKGLRQLLESAFLLPTAVADKLIILLAGKVRGDSAWLPRLAQRVNEETRVQVVLDDRFIREPETSDILRASDFVLVPYQQHVGSSNVLVRAAQVERPVLGQQYGLMGELVRRNRLGLAIDTTSPAVIADALGRFVTHPEVIPFDRDAARSYAESNSEARYAQTILDHLYSA